MISTGPGRFGLGGRGRGAGSAAGGAAALAAAAARARLPVPQPWGQDLARLLRRRPTSFSALLWSLHSLET